MLFDSGLELPLDVEFTVVGVDAGSGRGVLVADAGRVVLTTSHRFSYATGSSPRRVVQGQINGSPAMLVGDFWVRDGGEIGLLVSELRVGSDELDPEYTAVKAVFEHGAAVASYRPEDGAARSRHDSLMLPALRPAGAMTLRFPLDDGAVEIASGTAATLEAFDVHLAAFQDLLTVAEDAPVGRVSLEATDSAGRPVAIYGHDRYAPFGRRVRQPIEYTLRLGATYAQDVVNGWWRARDELRPVPQILAGTIYQSGFVESDLIALAATAERTGRALLPGMARGSATYRQVLSAIAAYLGTDLVRAAMIDQSEWGDHLLWARNDIAHEGAPNDRAGARFVTDEESRAVRDATRILVTLTLAKHIGGPDAVLSRAAERLGVRYGTRHLDTTIFRR